MSEEQVLIQKLTRAEKQAAENIGVHEARFLVDNYYQIQDFRKASANQTRAQVEGGEPWVFHAWYGSQLLTIENQIKSALDRFSAHHPLGKEVRRVVGIGPVIAAGLLAHIDIERAPTAGHIWSFAGLNPSVKWEKRQKRPWNAKLKVLCYKIGESFVKVQNNERDEYGHLYRAYKDELIRRNETYEFAVAAANKLATMKIGKTTDAYKAYSVGKLPPAHIHARARRWVVKLFLSDYHAAACRVLLGQEPPTPYAIQILGHAHEWKAQWLSEI